MSKAQFLSTMIILIVIIITVAAFVFLFFFALNLPQQIMAEEDFRERCKNICNRLNSKYVQNRSYAISYLKNNGWCDDKQVTTGRNESISTDCANFMGGCNVVSLGREVLSEGC